MKSDWKELGAFAFTWLVAWGAALAVTWPIARIGAPSVNGSKVVPLGATVLQVVLITIIVGLVVWYRYPTDGDGDGDGDDGDGDSDQ